MHAAAKDPESFAQTLREGAKLSLFILLPATVGLFALAQPIVQLLFEHGHFTSEDTRVTVYALINYLPGLIGYGLAYLLTRAFYALQDTRTPLVVGTVTVFVNVVLDYVLVGPLGVGGLALATSLAGIANALMLLVLLQKRLGTQNVRLTRLGFDIAKMLGTSALMGISVHFLARWASPLGEVFVVGLCVAFGVGMYLGLAWLWEYLPAHAFRRRR